jgi:hypothetical protein
MYLRMVLADLSTCPPHFDMLTIKYRIRLHAVNLTKAYLLPPFSVLSLHIT